MNLIGRNVQTADAESHPAPETNQTPNPARTFTREQVESTFRRVTAEMEELTRQTRWQEMIDLFHPLEDQCPELVAGRRDVVPRSRLAFALGHLQRYEDAITQLTRCIDVYPDNFMYHASLAYNAYSALYAAKNREIFLSGEVRRKHIERAHTHFRKAQTLRPDNVTSYYRQGMLYYRIQDKPDTALPLLLRAVTNWDGLTLHEQDARHMERKNFIKALYQAAGITLRLGTPARALALLERCLAEDEKSGHMGRMFKHFALGKIRFRMNRFPEARDALRFALQCREKNQPADFVFELLARVCLALDDPGRGLENINRIPPNRRRPYIRWTEADLLCALDRTGDARIVLVECARRDNQSRHRSLIRLARIEYEAGNFTHAFQCGAVADQFFRERWGNHHGDGCYWQAMSAFRLGETAKAEEVARILDRHYPDYYRLDELFRTLGLTRKGGAR